MSKLNENRPGYKKTRIGWIPEEWADAKLSSLVNGLQAGVSVNSHDEKAREGELSVLKTSAVTYGYFRPEENKRIVDGEIKRARVSPTAESIIISRMNTKDLVGANVYIEKDFSNLKLPDRLWQMQARNKKKYNPRWLGYLMASSRLRSILSIRATGTSGSMKNISKLDVLSIRIPLPPLPEQKKIAEILSAWDRAIERVGKLIDAKQRLKKGLLQQLLTGRMRFQEFGKPVDKKGQLPEGWQEVRGKKMFVRRSVKNSGKETVLSVAQDVGIVPRNSLDRKINMTDSNTDTYKLVEPGDFVISLRSFQGGIEYSNHRGIVSPAYHVIRPTVKVDNDFYRHYFKSYAFVGHLAIAVIGIRDGKQISYDDFAYMRFPYPSVPEQTRIATVLSTCDREIELLKKKLEKLKEQKKGLMQRLLTGEIRVKVEEAKG